MRKQLDEKSSATFTNSTLFTEKGHVIVLLLAIIERKFNIKIIDENLIVKFERSNYPEIFRLQIIHSEEILKTWVFTPTDIKDIADVLSLARIN